MWQRYLGLFLLTGVAGVASGFLWLVPNGLMAGALGLSLSVGTLWLGIKTTRAGQPASNRDALTIGAASGLLGGLLMAVISALCGGLKRYDFGPPVLPAWMPVVMGLLYGVVLHGCYHGLRTARRTVRQTLVQAGLACFVLKAVAVALYMILHYGGRSDLRDVILTAAVLSLLGAVPFALLWLGITAWLDPARPRPHAPENAAAPVAPALSQA